MVPNKSKALLLLRTLNDLLRRVSKTGSTTTFCGRILLFLSSVFELGERSGVNLRGEYGPEWESVQKMLASEDASGDVQPVDEKRDAFYHEFWSIQTPFSNPTKFADPDTFPAFKTAVASALSTIAEATKRERVLMGSKNSSQTTAPSTSPAGTKRKRHQLDRSQHEQTYFFAKFLTKPELLELEIADPQFRRQILFQLLILLQHLLSFTESDKKEWFTTRNTALQMVFTLDEDGEKWCKDTWQRSLEELRAIPSSSSSSSSSGKQLTDTLVLILRLERNWIRWKNAGCPSFDKPAMNKVGLRAKVRERRKEVLKKPVEYAFPCGSRGLSDIWDRGWDEIERSLTNAAPGETDLEAMDKVIRMQDQRIKMRTMQLERMNARQPVPSATPPPADGDAAANPAAAKPKPTPVDPQIKTAEEVKVKQSWLGMRYARGTHVNLMGAPNLSAAPLSFIPDLIKAVEKEKLGPEPEPEPEPETDKKDGMAVDEPDGDGSADGGTNEREAREEGEVGTREGTHEPPQSESQGSVQTAPVTDEDVRMDDAGTGASTGMALLVAAATELEEGEEEEPGTPERPGKAVEDVPMQVEPSSQTSAS